MGDRKIIIEKKTCTREKTRTLVELDNDVHESISILSIQAHRPIREIASILIRDALKYVEITENEQTLAGANAGSIPA